MFACIHRGEAEQCKQPWLVGASCTDSAAGHRTAVGADLDGTRWSGASVRPHSRDAAAVLRFCPGDIAGTTLARAFLVILPHACPPGPVLGRRGVRVGPRSDHGPDVGLRPFACRQVAQALQRRSLALARCLRMFWAIRAELLGPEWIVRRRWDAVWPLDGKAAVGSRPASRLGPPALPAWRSVRAVTTASDCSIYGRTGAPHHVIIAFCIGADREADGVVVVVHLARHRWMAAVWVPSTSFPVAIA